MPGPMTQAALSQSAVSEDAISLEQVLARLENSGLGRRCLIGSGHHGFTTFDVAIIDNLDGTWLLGCTSPYPDVSAAVTASLHCHFGSIGGVTVAAGGIGDTSGLAVMNAEASTVVLGEWSPGPDGLDEHPAEPSTQEPEEALMLPGF